MMAGELTTPNIRELDPRGSINLGGSVRVSSIANLRPGNDSDGMVEDLPALHVGESCQCYSTLLRFLSLYT